MPTTVTYYVDTASSGGDGTTAALSGTNAAFSSYQAARSALVSSHSDLVSSDELLQVYFNASTGTDDSRSNDDVWTITTDSTRYLELFFDSSYKLIQSNAFWSCIRITTTKVILHNPIIQHTGGRTSGGKGIHFGNSLTNGWYEIDGGTITSTGAGTPTSGHDGMYCSAVTNAVVIVRNAFVEGWYSGTFPNSGFGGGRTTVIYNVTAVNCNKGITIRPADNDTWLVKNNIGSDNNVGTSPADYFISGTGGTFTHSNNISSDTTGPDAALQSIDLTFNNSGAGDYSLAATDTDAIEGGVDLSGDTYGFTTDLLGVTRTDPWSIGAYEFITTTPQLAYPISDTSLGNWTDENDGTTNIFNSIDDVSINDTDYIKSGANPTADTAKFKLTGLSTPDSGDVIINVRAGLV